MMSQLVVFISAQWYNTSGSEPRLWCQTDFSQNLALPLTIIEVILTFTSLYVKWRFCNDHIVGVRIKLDNSVQPIVCAPQMIVIINIISNTSLFQSKQNLPIILYIMITNRGLGTSSLYVYGMNATQQCHIGRITTNAKQLLLIYFIILSYPFQP